VPSSLARHGRVLIPLGQGVYTITETCRILASMSRSTVHYWLNTGLLSEPPVAHAGKGTPTLLTFRQLLEVRTVQYLRTELHVSLPKVREAFAWVLATLFAESPSEVRFELGPGPVLIATNAGESIVVTTNQGAFPMEVVDGLNDRMRETRRDWDAMAFTIPHFPQLVANAHVQAGSPTITGSRVETSMLAAFAAEDGTFNDETVAVIHKTYPRLAESAVLQALEFEGLTRVAS
jgi:uncharacterized protein (DUF433 family)